MNSKTFHITDVLSITDGRLISTRHMDGVYEILNFMTGDHLFTHQLPRASRECKPRLLEQFPVLGSPEMGVASDELTELLKRSQDPDHIHHLITEWISRLTSGHFGVEVPETLDVSPIPAGEYNSRGPMEELLEMTGGKKEIHAIKLD